MQIIYCTSFSHLKEDFFGKLKDVYEDIYIVHDLAEIQNTIEGSDHHLPILVILDDMMYQFFASKYMTDLMTINSHHAAISIIVTSQNFFVRTNSRDSSTIKSQFSEYVIFPNRYSFEHYIQEKLF